MAEDKKEFSPIETEVMRALEHVIDPELGIDLVNLGLIYDVQVDDKGECLITMTLTTMGCPLGDLLSNTIIANATSVDGVNSCKIDLVWEPVWGIDKMSRFAKIALGIHE
ncbi:MAG: metal-sulfur cluster assembly factor [Limosilactobacillus sp.]|uniref:metal-sulfur cluster assembly factor n=1 Tax=Limosilactobacillus sp. TaxID=2773925 RepID=UPI002711C7E2|nr:metal-sulfur cluster assembly factor [Limosilactobacillus sp.]